MVQRDIKIKGAKIPILGIALKENWPDVRNTKVIDLVNSLNDYSTDIIIYDPWANAKEVVHEFNLEIINTVPKEKFDTIVFAVGQNEFTNLDFESLKKENSITYEIKGLRDRDLVDGKL